MVLVCRVSTLKENILIVGGNTVTPDEYYAFNYMASILNLNASGHINPICGGVILSTKTVLTAGHCLDCLKSEEVFVRVDSIDWTTGGFVANVTEVLIHKRFDKPTYGNNDLAVLLLQNDLPFGRNVGKVDIAGAEDEHLHSIVGLPVTISRYGDSLIQAEDKKLKWIDLSIVGWNECAAIYNNKPEEEQEETLTNHMFCYGNVKGKYLGKGDSGSKWQLLLWA